MEYIGLQSQIRRNNIRSAILLAMFPVTIVGLYFLGFFLYNALTDFETPVSDVRQNALRTIPVVLLAVALWFTIAWFTHTLMIRKATKMKPLSRKEDKRVYNLLENLCISRGMDMPALYVIDDNSLNAFASGISKKTYAITLSRGIIDKLNDDELEGVIAHELTHIRNRDVRLLIISIIFVGIFSFITEAALRSIRHVGRGKKKNTGVLILVILGLAAVGWLLSFLFKFAISRSREFLADAGAVELTKKPLALAKALEKISRDPRIEAVTREDVAQLFIEHPMEKKKSFFGRLFATHPPVEERIRVLRQF